jgi:SLOG cluster3 family
VNVFLSASFPSGERGERFVPFDPAAISSAIRAVARAILLAERRLIFGAHPTISPVILLVAGELEVRNAIEIYQSAIFKDAIPEETHRLVDLGYGRMNLVDADRSSEREPSLDRMRRAMLTEHPLAAGIFVGGMEGVLLEYRLLAELQPQAARLPLTAPGGAARELKVGDDPVSRRLAPMLGDERYPAMARSIISALG